jgi:hypothetical protein
VRGGDLGAGATLRLRPAEPRFGMAAAAAGRWLPEPAAPPRAIDDHEFRGGCTRTWAEPGGPVVVGGSGQLVMFACNDRVLQIHVDTTAATPDPLLVHLAQGANRKLHQSTGCPL